MIFWSFLFGIWGLIDGLCEVCTGLSGDWRSMSEAGISGVDGSGTLGMISLFGVIAGMFLSIAARKRAEKELGDLKEMNEDVINAKRSTIKKAQVALVLNFIALAVSILAGLVAMFGGIDEALS